MTVQRWYSYRENMLRGYVQKQTQANGIELTGDRPTSKKSVHFGNARGGYIGAAILVGILQNWKISEWDKD